MIELNLQPIPNQVFNATLETDIYIISIKTINDTNKMVIEISKNSEVLIQGLELVPYAPLIPYNYLAKGNFVLKTNNEDLADYTKFGVTQFLYYITELENV